MNRIMISLALSALMLCALVAVAQPRAAETPCPVSVEVNYASPTGPVTIAGCLSDHAYIGGELLVVVRSSGDPIFNDGFDGGPL